MSLDLPLVTVVPIGTAVEGLLETTFYLSAVCFITGPLLALLVLDPTRFLSSFLIFVYGSSDFFFNFSNREYFYFISSAEIIFYLYLNFLFGIKILLINFIHG